MERSTVRTYVLDSSVAVKWFVDEDDSDKARLLRDSFVAGNIEVLAPNLLMYEVASALRWHPTVQIDGSTISSALRALANYQFLTDPPNDAWKQALELSFRCDISPYDGIYVGLAHIMNAQLVTADDKLIGTLSSFVEKGEVISLAEFAL